MPGSMIALIGLAALVIGMVAIEGARRRRARFRAGKIIVGNHRVGPSGRCSVATFAGSAAGDVRPSAELFVNNATALTFDRQGNLYVASDIGNQVQVYAPGSTGLAQRLRNIQGLNTGLHRPTGLSIDNAGALYVAERGGPTHPSAVLKFAPGADGDVAPIAVIPSRMPVPGQTPAVNTRLDIVSGVFAVHPDGALYVVTCPEAIRGGDSRLFRFSPNASGDVAPSLEISLGTDEPQQVVEGEDGSVYVTVRGTDPAIHVYPLTVHGVPPTRVIRSPDMTAPFGIALDDTGAIFVADPEQQCVLVFGPNESGTVSPRQKIRGSITRLSDPQGIAVRVF